MYMIADLLVIDGGQPLVGSRTSAVGRAPGGSRVVVAIGLIAPVYFAVRVPVMFGWTLQRKV